MPSASTTSCAACGPTSRVDAAIARRRLVPRRADDADRFARRRRSSRSTTSSATSPSTSSSIPIPGADARVAPARPPCSPAPPYALVDPASARARHCRVDAEPCTACSSRPVAPTRPVTGAACRERSPMRSPAPNSAGGRARGARAPTIRSVVELHAPDGLASELAAADLVVTAGGVTMLEACCLGRPIVAFSIAPNQHTRCRRRRARRRGRSRPTVERGRSRGPARARRRPARAPSSATGAGAGRRSGRGACRGRHRGHGAPRRPRPLTARARRASSPGPTSNSASSTERCDTNASARALRVRHRFEVLEHDVDAVDREHAVVDHVLERRRARRGTCRAPVARNRSSTRADRSTASRRAPTSAATRARSRAVRRRAG